MTRSDNLYALPEGLPVPVDDGACDHLPGLRIPALLLPSTSGGRVDLSSLPGRTVVYLYPHTGRPDRDALPGWNDIPGARGCTPQTCAFRDHHAELRGLGAAVFGLSTQNTDYQKEAVERLHLPFELLSDERFELIEALRLPTFELAGIRFVKRITLILRDGVIEKVFYPVFPPDQNAEEVAAWLRENP
ncbi:MAG TPA: peroxiredoxin [Thermoanaerobaculia bacterium]|nr:peroxiredoxin [Thermoanaerobaculia bacterium]